MHVSEQIEITEIPINLSALQTKTGTFANSIDPDEMSHNEPSHLNLLGLLFIPML